MTEKGSSDEERTPLVIGNWSSVGLTEFLMIYMWYIPVIRVVVRVKEMKR